MWFRGARAAEEEEEEGGHAHFFFWFNSRGSYDDSPFLKSSSVTVRGKFCLPTAASTAGFLTDSEQQHRTECCRSPPSVHTCLVISVFVCCFRYLQPTISGLRSKMMVLNRNVS